jgi:hypothetical protein
MNVTNMNKPKKTIRGVWDAYNINSKDTCCGCSTIKSNYGGSLRDMGTEVAFDADENALIGGR